MRTVCTGLPSTRRSRRRSPASCSTDGELESLPHHLGGDAVGVGHGRRIEGGERAEGRPVVLGALRRTVGRVVGHLVVVAGDALTGRGQRIEHCEALHVLVGQLRDGRAHAGLRLSRGT